MSGSEAPRRTRPADPLFDVEGRVVVVTGAAGGIGGAVAGALAARGAVVIGADREAFENPALASSRVVDITRPDHVNALRDAVATLYGRVDGLVNVAGVGGSHPAESFPLERWSALVEVNLTGTFRLCQSLSPLLGEGASVVNVASTYGLRAPYALPSSAYAAAKAGVSGLTRALAAEWGPRGIRVTAVAPGHIETNMTRDRLGRPDYRDPVIARTPLRRVGTPGDVVGPILFLLTAGAAFVTGHTLVADGGWIIT